MSSEREEFLRLVNKEVYANLGYNWDAEAFRFTGVKDLLVHNVYLIFLSICVGPFAVNKLFRMGRNLLSVLCFKLKHYL